MSTWISVKRTLVEVRHENNPPVILGTPAQKTAAVSLLPNRGVRGPKGDATVIDIIDLGEFN